MNTASMQNQMSIPHEISEFPDGEERLPPAARLAMGRLTSNLFALWCLCEKGACRRAGRCKGDPNECLETLTPLLATKVIDGALCFFKGHEQGLSFEELYKRHPDEIVAFAHWRTCIDRRPLRPGAPDLPKSTTVPNEQQETAPGRRSRKRAHARSGL